MLVLVTRSLKLAGGSGYLETRISLSPMIKDRARARERFIWGGDVVGEAKREAPARVESRSGAVTLWFRFQIPLIKLGVQILPRPSFRTRFLMLSPTAGKPWSQLN